MGAVPVHPCWAPHSVQAQTEAPPPSGQNANLSCAILPAEWKCLGKMIIYWNVYSPEGKCSSNILTADTQHLPQCCPCSSLRGSGCLSRCQGIISAISPIPASVKCHCSAASADEDISQWLTAVPGIRVLHGTLLSLKFKWNLVCYFCFFSYFFLFS